MKRRVKKSRLLSVFDVEPLEEPVADLQDDSSDADVCERCDRTRAQHEARVDGACERFTS
jgi:hypothetical protein